MFLRVLTLSWSPNLISFRLCFCTNNSFQMFGEKIGPGSCFRISSLFPLFPNLQGCNCLLLFSTLHLVNLQLYIASVNRCNYRFCAAPFDFHHLVSSLFGLLNLVKYSKSVVGQPCNLFQIIKLVRSVIFMFAMGF